MTHSKTLRRARTATRLCTARTVPVRTWKFGFDPEHQEMLILVNRTYFVPVDIKDAAHLLRALAIGDTVVTVATEGRRTMFGTKRIPDAAQQVVSLIFAEDEACARFRAALLDSKEMARLG